MPSFKKLHACARVLEAPPGLLLAEPLDGSKALENLSHLMRGVIGARRLRVLIRMPQPMLTRALDEVMAEFLMQESEERGEG